MATLDDLNNASLPLNGDELVHTRRALEDRVVTVDQMFEDRLGVFKTRDNTITLAEAVASTKATAGDIVIVSDRENKLFEYKTGQTPDGDTVIACTGVPSLSLVYKPSNVDTFDSVAQMVATPIEAGLRVGRYYYTKGDAGYAEGIVKTAAQAAAEGDVIDGSLNVTLANGNVWIGEPLKGKWPTPLEFGAKVGGDATTNRLAIQACIDRFNLCYIPVGYELLIDFDANKNTIEGGVGIGIDLSSNQTLLIGGTIKLEDGLNGASSIMVGNTLPVRNTSVISVEGIGVVDGNRSSTTGDVLGVVLMDATDCTLMGFTARACSLICAGVRNINEGYGHNLLSQLTCYDSAYIGIQCRRPDLGLTIDTCTVYSTGDNLIDIEGNNSVDPTMPIGKRIIVSNNTLNTGGTCIFMESVGEVTITGNTCENFDATGVFLNRINSGSDRSVITGNKFKNGAGKIGVRAYNSSGKVLIANNMFETLRASFEVAGASGYVSIGLNYHANISERLLLVPPSATAMVKSKMVEQHYEGSRDVNGYPFTSSPKGATANQADRYFNVSVADAHWLDENKAMNHIKFKTNTAFNSGWGAYSIFFGGDTLVYITGGGMIVGEKYELNGTLFTCSGTTGAGEYIFTDENGVSGDYTTTTNISVPIYNYYDDWFTG